MDILTLLHQRNMTLIIRQILSHLNPDQDILNCRQVGKQWRLFVDDFIDQWDLDTRTEFIWTHGHANARELKCLRQYESDDNVTEVETIAVLEQYIIIVIKEGGDSIRMCIYNSRGDLLKDMPFGNPYLENVVKLCKLQLVDKHLLILSEDTLHRTCLWSFSCEEGFTLKHRVFLKDYLKENGVLKGSKELLWLEKNSENMKIMKMYSVKETKIKTVMMLDLSFLDRDSQLDWPIWVQPSLGTHQDHFLKYIIIVVGKDDFPKNILVNLDERKVMWSTESERVCFEEECCQMILLDDTFVHVASCHESYDYTITVSIRRLEDIRRLDKITIDLEEMAEEVDDGQVYVDEVKHLKGSKNAVMILCHLQGNEKSMGIVYMIDLDKGAIIPGDKNGDDNKSAWFMEEFKDTDNYFQGQVGMIISYLI